MPVTNAAHASDPVIAPQRRVEPGTRTALSKAGESLASAVRGLFTKIPRQDHAPLALAPVKNTQRIAQGNAADVRASRVAAAGVPDTTRTGAEELPTLPAEEKNAFVEYMNSALMTTLSAPVSLQPERFDDPKVKKEAMEGVTKAKDFLFMVDAFAWQDSLKNSKARGGVEPTGYKFLPDSILRSFDRKPGVDGGSDFHHNVLCNQLTGFLAGIVVKLHTQVSGIGARVNTPTTPDEAIRHDADAPHKMMPCKFEADLLDVEIKGGRKVIRSLRDQLNEVTAQIKQTEEPDAIAALKKKSEGLEEKIKKSEAGCEAQIAERDRLLDKSRALDVVIPEIIITFPGTERDTSPIRQESPTIGNRAGSFFRSLRISKSREQGAKLVRQMESHLKSLNETRAKMGLPACKLTINGLNDGGAIATFAALSAQEPERIRTIVLNPLQLSPRERAQIGEEKLARAPNIITAVWSSERWKAATEGGGPAPIGKAYRTG